MREGSLPSSVEGSTDVPETAATHAPEAARTDVPEATTTHAPQATAPPAVPATSGRRAGWGRFIAEMVLITVAVVLGFTVTEWGENRREERRADEAVAAITRELRGNLEQVAGTAPYYREISGTLQTVVSEQPGAAMGDVDIDGWRGLSPPLLRSASFDLAMTTGALEHVDFRVADALAQTYEVQSMLSFAIDQALAAAMAGQLGTVEDWLRMFSLLAELTGTTEQVLESMTTALNDLPTE